MKYILAIDQGTTGSRAVVYDKNGREIASHYNEFKQYFPRPGWVEHDAEEIWESVNKSVQKVLVKVPAKKIEAIGITNQRETVVVWDRRGGRPVTKAIVWQCRRTAEKCNMLKRNKKVCGDILQKTGLPVDAYFSASKIEWILTSSSAISQRARSGDIVFGTIDSWLLWKLTGGKVHATDHTNASRTMLFNINTKKWDDGLFRVFNVPRAMAPEVRESSGLFGATVRLNGLPAGIPITGIAGDQQSALFGQACFDKGGIKNTYGTGCFILLNSGKNKPAGKDGLITTLGCGPKGRAVYVLEGSIFIAGAAVQWLRDSLGVLSSSEESRDMSEKVKDNGGVYFVPALAGLGAPHWKSDARGLITGITRGTKREHIVRAALEAMCYQTKDVLDVMQKGSGCKVKSLKIDGGASKNDFLCQFQSDILGIDVVRPKVTETTSLGAAYLAGLGTGYWKGVEDIRKCWRADRTFTPMMTKRKRKTLIAEWDKAVKRTIV
ncbi:MAG: glycerol kinase GlpK [Candidatus Omnitrophota bacterium]